MTKFESLENESYLVDVDVVNYMFNNCRIKGLYCNRTIALSKELSTTEKSCILAEELGHYHTSVGDIIDQSKSSNRKQEFHARLWAYNRLIGLNGIINAYKQGCYSVSSTADFLGVTEDFLIDALACFRSKYGTFAQIDNYVIYFEPSIGVLELV